MPGFQLILLLLAGYMDSVTPATLTLAAAAAGGGLRRERRREFAYMHGGPGSVLSTANTGCDWTSLSSWQSQRVPRALILQPPTGLQGSEATVYSVIHCHGSFIQPTEHTVLRSS